MPSAAAPRRAFPSELVPEATPLRVAEEKLPFVAVRLSPDGVLVDADASLEVLMKCDVTALLHRPLAEWMHTDDQTCFAEALDQAMADGRATTHIRLFRADGKERRIGLYAVAVGEHIEAILLDVMRANMREEMLRLQAHYAEAAPALRHAALAGADGLEFLESAVSIVGETAGALRARACLMMADERLLVPVAFWTADERVIPEHVEIAPAEWPTLRAGQVVRIGPDSTEPVAQALLRTLGSEAAALVPFHDEDACCGIFLLERETPWRAAEGEALRYLVLLFETLWAWIGAEARYKMTLADLEDGLFNFVHDAEDRRRYLLVTPQFERLTGCPAAHLLDGADLEWATLVHEDDQSAFSAHEAVLAEGEPSRLIYRVVRPSDGEVRWLRESATPGRSPGGRLVVGGLISDVTDLKRAEASLVQARQAAERASQAKTAFMATMSHEIRTPLGAIRGFSQMLVEEAGALGPDAPPEVAEFAGIIAENMQRVLHLVHSLFDLSRLETGALELKRIPVELHPLVERVLLRYRLEAETKGLAVHVRPADAAPILMADPDRLEEVVTHLVSNAVKFTEQGTVTITTHVNEGAVQLVVEDTGIGIASEYLDQLFEPFSQEDYRLNRAYDGSGLGLAITKRLLDGMGGSIHVDSEKGVGSRFVIEFAPGDGARQ